MRSNVKRSKISKTSYFLKKLKKKKKNFTQQVINKISQKKS